MPPSEGVAAAFQRRCCHPLMALPIYQAIDPGKEETVYKPRCYISRKAGELHLRGVLMDFESNHEAVIA